LLVKLHYYGIQGALANWFRSYLADGKQNHYKNVSPTGEQ
jgi:hypothetical protein